MNEGEIRQAAAMWALVAEMEAIKIEVKGMEAENTEREIQGFALSWGQREFSVAATMIREIAKRLTVEI